MTEKEVRDIVRATLKSQMSSIPTKEYVKKIAQEEAAKEAKKAFKDSITQKEVRDMIKQTMHSYHKWMWEKKGMWMNQI